MTHLASFIYAWFFWVMCVVNIIYIYTLYVLYMHNAYTIERDFHALFNGPFFFDLQGQMPFSTHDHPLSSMCLRFN